MAAGNELWGHIWVEEKANAALSIYVRRAPECSYSLQVAGLREVRKPDFDKRRGLRATGHCP